MLDLFNDVSVRIASYLVLVKWSKVSGPLRVSHGLDEIAKGSICWHIIIEVTATSEDRQLKYIISDGSDS